MLRHMILASHDPYNTVMEWCLKVNGNKRIIKYGST